VRRAFEPTALLEAAALMAAALALRLVRLDTPPFVDELYHVLAAQSYLHDGTLVIGDGAPYTRAEPYTMLVAILFRIAGEGLATARIPSVLGGTLLVGAVFLWVRWAAGRAPAWIAGALVCLDAESIALSQVGRFYTWHVLLLWLGAVALYALRARTRSLASTVALAAGAALAFAGALELHDLSIIGVGLALLWLAGDAAADLARWLARDRRRVWLVAAPALAFLGAAFVMLDGPDLVRSSLVRFRYVDSWAAATAHEWRFYHYLMQEEYGLLWTLSPALAALAFLWRPRATAFLAWLFFAGFAVQSLAAWKTQRYLAYAMPAFFALGGIGITRLVVSARAVFHAGAERAFAGRWSGRAKDAGFAFVAVATALLALDAAFAPRHTMRGLTRTGPDRPAPYPRSDWQGALPVLAPLVADADAVVASADLKALYFLGRVDYQLSRNALLRGGGMDPEFTRTRQSGTPAVASPAALERIVACHADGIIVIDGAHFGSRVFVDDAAVAWIERNTTAVPLDPRLRVRAFRWAREAEPGAPTGSCPPRPDGDDAPARSGERPSRLQGASEISRSVVVRAPAAAPARDPDHAGEPRPQEDQRGGFRHDGRRRAVAAIVAVERAFGTLAPAHVLGLRRDRVGHRE
jgi:hypothetical protein